MDPIKPDENHPAPLFDSIFNDDDNEEQQLHKQKHVYFMKRALDAALRALKVGEVPVGCVFVRNNQVIAEGHNNTNKTKNATRHAEIEALDKLLYDRSIQPFEHSTIREQPINKDFEDVDVYVTLEPCIMCAAALRKMGFRRVFFGAYNDKFGGAGTVLSILQDENLPDNIVNCIGGLCLHECIGILHNFYERGNSNAPESKRKRPISFGGLVLKGQFVDDYDFDENTLQSLKQETDPVEHIFF
ncbi:hypothetical protein PCE1_003905 [Barthelona sp. PCE]